MSRESISPIVEIIAAETKARVGTVGRRTINLSKGGERLISVGLERGGVVVPTLSKKEFYQARRARHTFSAGEHAGEKRYPDAPKLETPRFDGTLSVLSQHVAEEGPEGRSSESIPLDDVLSKTYVLRRNEDSLWVAYDTSDESLGNYWTDATSYFLDAARPVESTEEAVAIAGIIYTFDMALLLHQDRAEMSETGYLPEGA